MLCSHGHTSKDVLENQAEYTSWVMFERKSSYRNLLVSVIQKEIVANGWGTYKIHIQKSQICKEPMYSPAVAWIIDEKHRERIL